MSARFVSCTPASTLRSVRPCAAYISAQPSLSLSVRHLSRGVSTSSKGSAALSQHARPTLSARPQALLAQAATRMQKRTLLRSSDGKADKSWLKKGEVKYSELKPYTDSPTGEITIIDVREPAEVAEGMIPSAVNVPLSQFSTAFHPDKRSNFRNDFAFDRPGFDDRIVFYCRSGKRSQQALEEAQKAGWWNTRNYTGSWLDWTQQEEAHKK